MPGLKIVLAVSLGVFAAGTAHLPGADADNWPQWRGVDQVGRSTTATGLPTTWSETENVAWRVELPSWSAATPIIWDDYVFVTSAEEGFKELPQMTAGGADAAGRRRGASGGTANSGENEHTKLYVLALNRKDGSVRWKQPIGDGNQIYRKHNMASPSPVTDGKHVWVMTGVGVLTAFDFDGNRTWQRDFQEEYGKFGLNWGYASSPKLHEDRLYIQVLHGMTTDEPSYIVAVDKNTGKTIWKVDRPTDAQRESPDNYATPILVPVDGKLQLVVSGGDYVTGHDLDTGKELWRLGGFNPDNSANYRTIASSIFVDDVVITTSRAGRPFIGFRAGGSGDITGKSELRVNDLGTDVPTPTTDGEIVYVINDKGIAVALEAKTGKLIWERQRIEPGTYSASPLLADGKIYATSEDGTTTVLKAGKEFEILAVNKLDNYTLASPVAAGNQLFIRTMRYLYCISNQ